MTFLLGIRSLLSIKRLLSLEKTKLSQKYTKLQRIIKNLPAIKNPSSCADSLNYEKQFEQINTHELNLANHPIENPKQ